MVAPALLAAVEMVKGLGPAAQGAVFTFRYVGTTRWWKKHCPEGMVVTLPAWLVILLTLIGGVTLVYVFMDEITKGLDKMGIKTKEKNTAEKFQSGDWLGGFLDIAKMGSIGGGWLW